MSTPQQLVEQALAASDADECVVIVDDSSSANLRWANNTLTTNGSMHSCEVTVISYVDGASGAANASLSRSTSAVGDVLSLVADADAAARAAGPAQDANELARGQGDTDYEDPPASTSISVFEDFAPALGEVLERARAGTEILYGYVEHDVTTTYLGSSTGLRRRHAQPGGHVGITAKSADLARSAWVGASTRDFTDVDATALGAELSRRLAWSTRTIDLPAGRYDTILPPTAVADLMIYAYWTATARDAHEGQTVFGRPGGGTRIGDQLSSRPISLYSDPTAPGLECAPFVTSRASSGEQSVYDNGLDAERTSWVDRGRLDSLIQTRQSATLTGQPFTPMVDNLLVSVDGATGDIDEQIAGVERGLLLTCLWYIREVEPQSLLLTGLTRDGVYLIENGEVTGAVNNFRFNESPVDLLGRFTSASETVRSFSREWGDYFLRTATPALRVPDFNMSSVSQAH